MTERSSPDIAELLPCPFCTSEDVHECFGVGGTYLVSCASCEGQGPRATNEETAKSAWNTRTLPPSSAGIDGWHRELIDREPDHGQYGHAGVDTMERLRQYAAYGDTAEGRILAQLALTEIERLNGVAQPTQLCSCKASQRDGRHMEWCPMTYRCCLTKQEKETKR